MSGEFILCFSRLDPILTGIALFRLSFWLDSLQGTFSFVPSTIFNVLSSDSPVEATKVLSLSASVEEDASGLGRVTSEISSIVNVASLLEILVMSHDRVCELSPEMAVEFLTKDASELYRLKLFRDGSK